VDKVTRRELKQDRFALEVEHSVDYVSGHRREFIKWGAIGLAAVLLIVGVVWYRSYEHQARQELLAIALQDQNTQPGPPQSEYAISFPSQADKDQAVTKAFSDVVAKYPGSDEAMTAEFYLAAQAVDKGDLAQAQKRFQLVVDSGPKDYASLAKLSLAQIYQSQGKLADAEKLVRSVIDNPTALVSKEQATINLARLVATTNPQEARKLLEPLRASERSAVSRAALTALSDLPQK
jgi:predicted negative regulator of RcsB-dependent stress response